MTSLLSHFMDYQHVSKVTPGSKESKEISFLDGECPGHIQRSMDWEKFLNHDSFWLLNERCKGKPTILEQGSGRLVGDLNADTARAWVLSPGLSSFFWKG